LPLSQPSLLRNEAWLLSQIDAGVLPDVVCGWTPRSTAEDKQKSGELVIVLWTDPETGERHRIGHEDMPMAVLTAFRGQWDEATLQREASDWFSEEAARQG
jgi:hypothetical protein